MENDTEMGYIFPTNSVYCTCPLCSEGDQLGANTLPRSFITSSLMEVPRDDSDCSNGEYDPRAGLRQFLRGTT